jgi:hypothetical protein
MGWRWPPPPTLDGGRWWGSLVALQLEQGSRRCHGGPVMLLIQSTELGRPSIDEATAAGSIQRR